MFREDLLKGQKSEYDFKEILERWSQVVSVETNNDYRYDLKAILKDGKVLTFEVKTDFKSAETGNIGIEFECRGKPSGIGSSEADIWIFKLEDGFWSISSNNLKQLIDSKSYFRVVVGGDKGSNTKMYLFKDTLKRRMRRWK